MIQGRKLCSKVSPAGGQPEPMNGPVIDAAPEHRIIELEAVGSPAPISCFGNSICCLIQWHTGVGLDLPRLDL